MTVCQCNHILRIGSATSWSDYSQSKSWMTMTPRYDTYWTNSSTYTEPVEWLVARTGRANMRFIQTCLLGCKSFDPKISGHKDDANT
jgi:hypothetical protein